jgi:GAF domain-containing protein
MTPDQPIVNESVNAVSATSIVPTILEIICRTTGMGFAAVARVTPERWIACEVRDEIQFGLKTGGELKVDTTLCHEIRQSGKEVVIDDVVNDEYFCAHHTPLMYGFRSYISVPICLADNSFFGTLCAIDPNPAVLVQTPVRSLFVIYSSLIAFLIDAQQLSGDQFRKLREHCVVSLRAHLVRMTGYSLEQPSSNTEVNKALKDHEKIEREIELLKELLNELKSTLVLAGNSSLSV